MKRDDPTTLVARLAALERQVADIKWKVEQFAGDDMRVERRPVTATERRAT